MAKQKQNYEEPKKQIVESYKSIYDLAEKLGLKKENVEAGMKSNPEKTADMITKAYAFRFKGK